MTKTQIAIIGGTGLTTLFAGETETFDGTTPYGPPSAPLMAGSIAGRKVAFLPRHGNPHRIPPHKINYRANLWALKQRGVNEIIAVNTVGGIRREWPAGTLLIPEQIIDYTYGREHTFSDGAEALLQHIDFSAPFDTGLRNTLLAAAAREGVAAIDGGVYGVTQGPRLETAAEIERMARDGCDVVGMTAMPEAALARELGIGYAIICLVVNPAAGRGESPITMASIAEVTATGLDSIRILLAAAIASLGC